MRFSGFEIYCQLSASRSSCFSGHVFNNMQLIFAAADGEQPDDTFVHSASRLGYSIVNLGRGNDNFTFAGGDMLTVDGNRDRDTITVASGGTIAYYNGGHSGSLSTLGEANAAFGGIGVDTFILDGGTVRGAISGEDNQVDIIIITSGTVGGTDGGNIDGGTGNDRITLSAATLSGYVTGGDGDDTISVTTSDVTAAGSSGLVFDDGTQDCDPDTEGAQWICGGAPNSGGTGDILRFLSNPGANPAWLFDSSSNPRFAGFENYESCSGYDAPTGSAPAGTLTGCTSVSMPTNAGLGFFGFSRQRAGVSALAIHLHEDSAIMPSR